MLESLQIGMGEWLLAGLGAILIGFSKAGIKGISIIAVTIMAIVFGGKSSTGIVVSMLIMGDIMAVWYYNRHTKWEYIIKFLPPMMLGVLVGVYAGKDLPEHIFKQGMAVIILFSVLMMLWWDRRESKEVPTQWWFAGIMGFAAGFTTMIGNLAGAFANIFFLAMRLPKDQFIGTAAWLFFIINLFKLPFHIFVWETISLESFKINLLLLPTIVLGFIVGIQLVKKINNQSYRNMILILTALGAILIFLK